MGGEHVLYIVNYNSLSYQTQHQRKGSTMVQPSPSMPTVAELVDRLFQTRLHPEGRPYTYREVTTAMGGDISYNHIKSLHLGSIKNPTRETLLALCLFFRVHPTYFFPELDEIEGDLERLHYHQR